MKFPRLHPLAIAKRLVLAYLLTCLFMWMFQRHLLYVPLTPVQPPSAYGLHGFNAIRVQSSDGVHVELWQHPAQPGYPTIVYFHGNGGNLAGRAHYFSLLAQQGFGLLALDYRGYGNSEGTPSEQGFYRDARATLAYARTTLALVPSQIILYGESIGTGVAVQMATETPSAALVLQSPFTSIDALAADNYPWLPVRLLLQDHFDSLGKLSRIHTPLLLFHGEKDGVVPIANGRTLFAHASEPKEAVYFPTRGHTDFDLAKLTQALTAFCYHYRIMRLAP